MQAYRQQLQHKFNEEYSKLNKEQQRAVDTTQGPVMVIAGPGTGKTQILAARIGKILSKNLGAMYPGQVIEYKVHPVLGIPLYWMTEITQVVQHKYFIDEQRFGPYELWHHQHHFKEVPGGVEMTDHVHYKLPFWFLGDIANVLFVKKQLKGIFDYRFKKVVEMFGEK